MKKYLAVIALLFSGACYAQQEGGSQYNSAVGLKVSAGVAVSYKTFVTGTNALEAQAMYFNEGVRLAALYQFHFFQFDGVPGLAWYVGPGAHIGFWRKSAQVAYNSRIDLGIDGVLGLDYKIPKVPLNISLDWQPGFSVLGAGLQPQFGGIGLRYILK
ncbi:hypothetical protein [Aridibaculum aurantiacum]|uniref:hypothetical protein n=1 Tax=Aridibaculum aurantiacum TaxID=2810307 RepID=UPI001A968384|nr:hypothetical protein [Aridibaculum aurantiacum]